MDSPECMPDSTSLDFSIYNLDPSLHSSSSRAFSTATTTDGVWIGKGFLSWCLAEPGQGSSLVKGRLVKDSMFGMIGDTDRGLEGLVRSRLGDEEWGLEVSISLKQVNPEGKGEFAGRRAFEELVNTGRPPGGRSQAQTAGPSTIANRATPQIILPMTAPTAQRVSSTSSSAPPSTYGRPSSTLERGSTAFSVLHFPTYRLDLPSQLCSHGDILFRTSRHDPTPSTRTHLASPIHTV